MHRTLAETTDPDVAACLRSYFLDTEHLLSDIVSDGQKLGLFRAQLDPRVAAWELIRTAMGYELTLSLHIPVYEEPNYVQRTLELLLTGIVATVRTQGSDSLASTSGPASPISDPPSRTG